MRVNGEEIVRYAGFAVKVRASVKGFTYRRQDENENRPVGVCCSSAL